MGGKESNQTKPKRIRDLCVCLSQGNLKYIIVAKYLDVQLMEYNKSVVFKDNIDLDIVT